MMSNRTKLTDKQSRIDQSSKFYSTLSSNYVVSNRSITQFLGKLAMSDPVGPRLRLGSVAPDFAADTQLGHIDSFHEWKKGSWAILFSHPDDRTPVCTTELGAISNLSGEFGKRGVKLIGISANDVESHKDWIKDINEVSNTNLTFPIIADKSRKISYLYDMLDYQDTTNVDQKGLALTIRVVFFIDPKNVIRAKIEYPASTGRNSKELLRVVDSLQTGDKNKIATPIDWQTGDDVIIPVVTSDAEAKEKFPGYRTIKPYLRYTSLKGN